jgi:HAD superfamily hydrolase (TIGR01509 family)
MKSSLIKALIFDFDGLILDTETPLLESWFEILTEYGLTVPITEWAARVGDPSMLEHTEKILRMRIDQPDEWERISKRRYQRELELLMHEDALPGVRGIIGKAKRRGMHLGVASSSETPWVTSHLARLGIIEMFDCIQCADDAAQNKPAPDLYLAVLSDMELAARHAIAFEDSPLGIQAAKAAGIFCIAVPNRVTEHSTMSAADIVVKTLTDMSLDEYINAAQGQGRMIDP